MVFKSTDYTFLASGHLTTSTHWSCNCNVHDYVVTHFCDSMWSFWIGNNLCTFFYHLFIYVFPLEILLSREEGWDPTNQFYPTKFLCLSQARTWIWNIICRGFFCVQWSQLRWEVIIRFVDISWIDDHHCLNFLFIIIDMLVKLSHM